MKSYVAKRLILLIPTLLGVVTLVFFLIHMIPGDPVEVMLGETAQSADKERLRQDLGLDQPIPVQYAHFLEGLAKGDMGRSYFYRQPVSKVIIERIPATAELALAGMIVALIIAIPLGIIAALRKNTAIDHGSMFLSLVGVSMPHFWLGPLLILAFAIAWPLFPASGREGLASLVLPAVTLGTALAAVLSRMTRASVLESLGEQYVTAARARGLPERRVIGKHVLRNALIPVVTIVGLQFGSLLSGAVITENVFSWPGLGTLFIGSIQSRDYPVVQGCVLFISLTYVLINLATDLIYAAIDPRIRYQ